MEAFASVLRLSFLFSSALPAFPLQLPPAPPPTPKDFSFSLSGSSMNDTLALFVRGFLLPAIELGFPTALSSSPALRAPISLPSRGVTGIRPLLESPVELAGLLSRSRPVVNGFGGGGAAYDVGEAENDADASPVTSFFGMRDTSVIVTRELDAIREAGCACDPAPALALELCTIRTVGRAPPLASRIADASVPVIVPTEFELACEIGRDMTENEGAGWRCRIGVGTMGLALDSAAAAAALAPGDTVDPDDVGRALAVLEVSTLSFVGGKVNFEDGGDCVGGDEGGDLLEPTARPVASCASRSLTPNESLRGARPLSGLRRASACCRGESSSVRRGSGCLVSALMSIRGFAGARDPFEAALPGLDGSMNEASGASSSEESDEPESEDVDDAEFRRERGRAMTGRAGAALDDDAEYGFSFKKRRDGIRNAGWAQKMSGEGKCKRTCRVLLGDERGSPGHRARDERRGGHAPACSQVHAVAGSGGQVRAITVGRRRR